MLRKISLAALLSAVGFFSSTAHAEGWVGYMNVFENNAGAQGGYVFGAVWGVPDLKTTVLSSNSGTYFGDQLQLEPNFNTYADNNDAFWRDGSNGNKFMEANTYVEFNPIGIASTSFSGTIDSYTLASGYQAHAFIKVLNPGNGWSTDLFSTFDLATGSSFSLNADLTAHQGKVLQLGYVVTGLNANPANTNLGSVVVTVIPEPSTYALIFGGLVGLLAWRFRRRS
jgi:hypothetical protein